LTLKAAHKILLTLILAVITLFILAFGFYKYVKYAGGLSSKEYYEKPISAKIIIKRGDNLIQIAQYLSDNKIIVSKIYFIAYSKFKGYGNKYKAGEYFFTNELSYKNVASVLMKGGNVFYKATIPEGLTAEKISELLEDKTKGNINFSGKVFLEICASNIDYVNNLFDIQIDSIEGFLFPETYTYTKDDNETTFFKMIIDRFNNKTVKLRNIPAPQSLNFYDLLKLASIVQREAAYADEMPTIAGVYYNRLEKNMKLQADPTILYAMNYSKNRLLYKHLKLDTLYNTYIYYGLPPTPICNPGFDAIYNTVYPEIHNYLFFVADTNMRHQFSSTGREHERKRIKIKAKRKELERMKLIEPEAEEDAADDS